ncbi:MAG: divalent-cation tolerance protein CutA [Deltaproteobacteria bacterium]|nr:divalent-cation tolerance protein CutA [Deltaproteobacteria bacterium]
MAEFIIVFVTTGSEEEAEKIARNLIEEKLAACANIVGPIRSIYRWQDKVADDKEWLLLIKTRESLFPQVEKRVKEWHSYQVPEVVALPILAGSPAYLRWVKESTEESRQQPAINPQPKDD